MYCSDEKLELCNFQDPKPVLQLSKVYRRGQRGITIAYTEQSPLQRMGCALQVPTNNTLLDNLLTKINEDLSGYSETLFLNTDLLT